MKTAQLPPVRVEPSVRKEIEDALRDGESLSEFVEAAAIAAARRRKAQEAFLVRGRASLARARRTGEFYDADQVLDSVQHRLNERVGQLWEQVERQGAAPAAGKASKRVSGPVGPNTAARPKKAADKV